MNVSTILVARIRVGTNDLVNVGIHHWAVGTLDRDEVQEAAIEKILNLDDFRRIGATRRHVEVHGFVVTTPFEEL